MSYATILLTIGKTIGTILISLLMTLLTGKTFKTLLLAPFQWLANRPGAPKIEQKLVESAEKDLGVDP